MKLRDDSGVCELLVHAADDSLSLIFSYLTHKKQTVFVSPNSGLERKEESLLFHTWPVMRSSACSHEGWVAPMKIPQGECMAPNYSGYTVTSPKVRCANGRENGCNL